MLLDFLLSHYWLSHVCSFLYNMFVMTSMHTKGGGFAWHHNCTVSPIQTVWMKYCTTFWMDFWCPGTGINRISTGEPDKFKQKMTFICLVRFVDFVLEKTKATEGCTMATGHRAVDIDAEKTFGAEVIEWKCNVSPKHVVMWHFFLTKGSLVCQMDMTQIFLNHKMYGILIGRLPNHWITEV